MVCEKCGKEIADDLKLCEECAAKENNTADGATDAVEPATEATPPDMTPATVTEPPAEAATETVTETAEAATETVTETAEAATETVTEAAEAATETMTETAEAVTETVTETPAAADSGADSAKDTEHTVLMSELENLTEYEPITQKNKKKKIMIASVAVLVTVAAVAGVVFATMNSGKKYLYSVLLQTSVHFAQEYKQMTDGNQVLKRTKELMAQPYTQKINTGGAKIAITDDKENKKLGGELSVNGIPIGLQLYLSDTRLVVGSPMLTFLEADPANLGQDVASFAENNGLSELGAEIAKDLAPYDFSYEKFVSGKVLKTQPDPKEMAKRYGGILMKLVEKSDYQKSSSDVPIGESAQKCDLLTLTANRAQLLDWFKNDLEPAVTSDKELEEYLNSADSLGDRMDVREFSGSPYGELKSQIAEAVTYLENEANECNLLINMYAYKKVIAKATMSFSEKDSQKLYMNVNANGATNRLDQVALDLQTEDGNSLSVSATGSHVGSPVIASNITASSEGSDGQATASVQITWDTIARNDNFDYKITDGSGGENLHKATFAIDGESVKILADINETDFSWEIMPIQGTVTIPEKAMKIKDVTLNEILDSMGVTGDLIRNYLMSGLFR